MRNRSKRKRKAVSLAVLVVNAGPVKQDLLTSVLEVCFMFRRRAQGRYPINAHLVHEHNDVNVVWGSVIFSLRLVISTAQPIAVITRTSKRRFE